ncbi:glycosyl hydrolase family 16 [Flavobacterium sp.]|uniref:glycosyl hydrolase family 16 n=1 Tax=Flavobacterium sp. TaxID=239 RepID=UPI00286C8261|nr:glycosyl hydrolase family 16 [Flavobacterium sp.]
MKTHLIFKSKKTGFVLLGLLLILGCQNDDSDLQDVKASKDPNVFIDTFSGGLNFAAFSGTDIFAFQVDNEVTYNNTNASMRFDVPNANDPAGAYAGGAFFTGVGRDLSSYNALTFWAKSSVAATVGVIGFGIDLGANKYPASLNNLKLSTVWKKYIIPIPDASKLKTEKGLFYISAGPENGNGFSFWVDEVKFETLGTLAYAQPAINNGLNTTVTSFNGVSLNVAGLTTTYNLLNGTNQIVTTSPNYFSFASSNVAVATVDAQGLVSTVGAGTAIITGSIGGVLAKGNITIQSLGNFTAAPAQPVRPAANVISIFSNAYANAPVQFYNGYWEPYQTTKSADFISNGDAVLNYTNFNFVGIQFGQPTVNATTLTHLHFDLYIPGTVAPGANFKIRVVDFGANGADGGGDDSSHTLTYTSPILVSQNWISLNIPFTSFSGLTSRARLGQIILEGSNIPNFYADNIYFYKN